MRFPPGPVETDMIITAAQTNPGLRDKLSAMLPLGRIAQPEDVAELAIFLLSDRANNISGANYAFDGGQTA